ncbi:MAG: 30S ribosomal protein S3 [Candidatus Aenigmarchaeota archaeon ex4484_52]|nr:MAG: 30S ribosomal protein S3 [Candidatus Aenigmarchaeota archaeon ex4484_52]
MIEKKFISNGVQKEQINRYIIDELKQDQITNCIIKKTPLYTHVIIYSQRPASIIGFRSSKLMQLKQSIISRFNIENLKIDVYGIDNPYLDASLMANQIARSMEKGIKHRKIVSFIINKIMNSGAIGVQIDINGKISGSRSRGDKFYKGYLKKCGDPAKTCTDEKKVMAILKQGSIGIKVKIMKYFSDVMQLEKNINKLEMELKKKTDEEKKKKMIIVFDLGGVVFSNGLKIAIEKINEKYNIDKEIIESVLKGSFSQDYRKGTMKCDEFWQKAKEKLNVKNIEEIKNIFFDSYILNKEVIEFIKKLKKDKIRVGFLSNSPEDMAKYLDKKFNIRGLFDFGLFSYEVHLLEPDKEIYEKFLEKFNFKAEEITYIDDKQINLEKPKELGMKVILFEDIKQLQKDIF